MFRMSILLMKWISIISAICAICTCLAILAQTLDESSLPVPLVFCRMVGALLATSQFICSLLIYFKLQQILKLWGMSFYLFTLTAFCTTINYITYSSLRHKYTMRDNKPYVDFSIIDTCIAVDFAIFIVFHLIIIFDCDSHNDDDDYDSEEYSRPKRATIPYKIFTIEAHDQKV